MCTCIYFADIGSFDGEEMPPPPPDLGVDPHDEDEGMPDITENHHEAGPYQRPAPVGALMRGRCLSDARYRMELGDQLIALIVEAGIKPAHYRDIEADDRLLWKWRGMPCDMYSLMWHVVAVTTAFT